MWGGGGGGGATMIQCPRWRRWCLPRGAGITPFWAGWSGPRFEGPQRTPAVRPLFAGRTAESSRLGCIGQKVRVQQGTEWLHGVVRGRSGSRRGVPREQWCARAPKPEIYPLWTAFLRGGEFATGSVVLAGRALRPARHASTAPRAGSPVRPSPLRSEGGRPAARRADRSPRGALPARGRVPQEGVADRFPGEFDPA